MKQRDPLLDAPEHAPSLGRALGLVATSFSLMLAIMALFYWKTPTDALSIPWISTAISIGAVLAPTLVAWYWPRDGAPGGRPPYGLVSPWMLAGAALCSLPLYVGFALLQMGVGHLFKLDRATALVEPLTSSSLGAFAWIWLAIAALPALAEELLYRGMVQTAAVHRFGVRWGLVASAVLFSLIHMEPAGFLSRILMGLWFGTLFLFTGSLWTGTLAHALNNSWGVILANWHVSLEAHMPWVYAVAAVSGLAGLACLRRAGFWPGATLSEKRGVPAPLPGPELPRFITVHRPEPPSH